MQAIYANTIKTLYGEKSIEVFSGNIVDFDKEIDVLITSAFRGSYTPSPRTLFEALYRADISVQKLSRNPEIDLRDLCNLWLSKEIQGSNLKIRRVGCIEMRAYAYDQAKWESQESDIITSIKAYFKMLEMASAAGINIEYVAMPLLGAGNQNISSDLTLIPIINESINFLKRNACVKKIYFIDFNYKNALKIVAAMQKMYSLQTDDMDEQKGISASKAKLFISYTSKDKNVADNLCSKLEAHGIKVWYAPRDVLGNDYASSIVKAISECTHFVTIISKNSMMSEHVLNEIDHAFNQLRRNIRFLPLRIDIEELRPAFSYYLSRQHWMDAHDPPIENRLEEFVERIVRELN